MKIRSHLIISTLLLIILANYACLHRSGNLPPVSQWPPQQVATKKSVSLMFTCNFFRGDKKKQVRVKDVDTWSTQTLRVYQESSLFSGVQTSLTETDLRAEVKLTIRDVSNTPLLVLAGLTLFIIPCREKIEFTLETVFKNQLGDVLFACEKREDLTALHTFIEFPMTISLIGLFTYIHIYEVKFQETIYELNRATINELLNQGIF